MNWWARCGCGHQSTIHTEWLLLFHLLYSHGYTDSSEKVGSVPGVPGDDYPVHQEHIHHDLRNVPGRFPCPADPVKHFYLADRASRCQVMIMIKCINNLLMDDMNDIIRILHAYYLPISNDDTWDYLNNNDLTFGFSFQIFYVCYGDESGVPMLCPNGTLFNEQIQVCDWWFNVVCWLLMKLTNLAGNVL